MPEIVLETFINAPAETCFDLIRDVRLHPKTEAHTYGKAGLGQIVAFEGKLLRMRQRLTVKVIDFERPRLLTDEMIEGTFKRFTHIHEFSACDGGTLARDTLRWSSPFGILGRVVDKLLIERHLRKLVSGRNSILKQIAETNAKTKEPADGGSVPNWLS